MNAHDRNAGPGFASVRGQTRLWWAALGIGLLALSLTLRVASLVDAPLDRDEGAYALIAQQWRHGALPYRDYFDHKPPLVYVAYRLAFAITGEHLAAIRALFAVVNACTALACGITVWRLTHHAFLAPLLAALAACVFLNSPLVQGETANAETLMALGTTCAAALVLGAMRSGRALTALVAGTCAGLAALAKPVALCEAVFFTAWLATPWFATHAVRRRGLVIAFGIGLVLPSVAWGLYALASGTLSATVDAVFMYNARYASAAVVPLWARLAALPIDYGAPLALLWAGVGGCMLTALRSVLRTAARPANFALGWTAAALVGTLAGGRIYAHYYQQIIPPMAVALGVTAAAVGHLMRGRGARLAYAAVVTVGLWPPLAAIGSFATQSAERTCAGWQPRLAAVIRSLTVPDDRVLVWGAEPYLAFAAERRPINRFIYKYPLLGDSPSATAARHELFALWEEHRPAVIVVVKREDTAEPGRSAAAEIVASDAPFHRLLTGFAPVLETSDFVLYTQPDAAPLPWSARWEQTEPCSRHER